MRNGVPIRFARQNRWFPLKIASHLKLCRKRNYVPTIRDALIRPDATGLIVFLEFGRARNRGTFIRVLSHLGPSCFPIDFDKPVMRKRTAFALRFGSRATG